MPPRRAFGQFGCATCQSADLADAITVAKAYATGNYAVNGV